MSLPYKVTVVAPSKEKKEIEKLILQCFDLINETANSWNPHSEISSLSARHTTKAITISPTLSELFHITDKIYHLTNQRFDPTIAPIMMAYQKNDLHEVKAIGWEKISYGPSFIQKKDEKISFDLCGIAKGYCIDLIAEKLASHGYRQFLIEWAGDLRASGMHPEKRPWLVSVNGIEEIKLQDCAIATSTHYMPRYWEKEDKHYFHIIDPKSQKPLSLEDTLLSSVSVQAKNCAEADALATAMMTCTSKEELLTLVKELTEKDKDLIFWFSSKEKL